MGWLLRSPLDVVFRRRENDGEPVNDRRLRARLTSGEIVRVAPGSFAPSAAWDAATSLERHAQRVWEAAARADAPRLFSHCAAAALHGIDILGTWPSWVDVSIAASSGGRSSGHLRRHARRLDDVVTMPWGRHEVTTPLQTAVDLMAALPFVQGVAVGDQALWRRRPAGALVGAGALRDRAASLAGRGSARAARAAAFATDLSDSVRESQSRVLIATLGFPPPVLQAHFRRSGGGSAYADFFWPEHSHIGEFDGEGKYRDPGLLDGRTPHEVLMDEKDREDDLRRQVDAFSRWRTRQLRRPQLLFDILVAAGLPTGRSRPGR